MNFLIIGDVHGCFYTFKNLINKHWNEEEERLIQLGDLIDRGKNSPQMVQLAQELSLRHPNNVIFLKGNHELEIQEHVFHQPNTHWLRHGGEETLKQYDVINRDFKKDAGWLRERPLYWENDYLFVSHAGISLRADDPFNEEDKYGILWNRSPLKHLGKLQVIGHTPCEEPVYDNRSHSWNIDTGAAFNRYLTGVRVSFDGEVLGFIREETDQRDLKQR